MSDYKFKIGDWVRLISWQEAKKTEYYSKSANIILGYYQRDWPRHIMQVYKPSKAGEMVGCFVLGCLGLVSESSYPAKLLEFADVDPNDPLFFKKLIDSYKER